MLDHVIVVLDLTEPCVQIVRSPDLGEAIHKALHALAGTDPDNPEGDDSMTETYRAEDDDFAACWDNPTLDGLKALAPLYDALVEHSGPEGV